MYPSVHENVPIGRHQTTSACSSHFTFKPTHLLTSPRSNSATQQGSQDPSALVQNFLQSLQQRPSGQARQSEGPFTTLNDLLPPATTIPFLHAAAPAQIDALCALLPADLFVLAQESASAPTLDEPEDPAGRSSADAEAALASLSLEQKKEILARALRSPQLQQSLGSLTVALRDGGLPMIGDALGLRMEHGGLVRGGSMPLGGAEAVRGFVEGVRRRVLEERKAEGGDDGEDGTKE